MLRDSFMLSDNIILKSNIMTSAMLRGYGTSWGLLAELVCLNLELRVECLSESHYQYRQDGQLDMAYVISVVLQLRQEF